ncbi:MULTISPECIES: lysylphosphatidylglycerol synthase transmembrane domain-containing protein [unclassified Prochlorococcus]|uniref:lysylphosphatidylglycerol synthase transmembrane domain-containing protein n=1 Tax=unclassified Prochlorococcus TaxID=2627481 RepID=UPI0005337FA9|nr:MULTISPECIES: lysylphosphatidylglycerol synthase transmembrane domain-containing protein [unclassified Prochlorococcus]KGG16893.1 hypothetical protein EV06_0740 [Prochlorococcus sp. MIT 0602]KGG18132.1 hypothetical protein EV07_0044 [Prochlorococcus sp. MIT 0603]
MLKINWIKLFVFGLLFYTISLLCLAIIDFNQTLSILPIKFWLISLLVPLLVHFILSIRWFIFLKFLGCQLVYRESLGLYLPGLSLIAAPARSGEAIRGLWLESRFRLPIEIGISTTFVERIGDLISALLIICWSVYFSDIYIIPIIYVIFITFIFVVNHLKIGISIINFLFNSNRFNFNLNQNKYFRKIYRLFKQSRLLSMPYPLSISILLSLIAWIIESYLLYSIFSYLNIDMSFKYSALIRTCMGIGGVISFLPAGLLASESTAIGLSIALGSGRIEALVATIFIRLYTLFLPFVIGLLTFYIQKDLKFSK